MECSGIIFVDCRFKDLGLLGEILFVNDFFLKLLNDRKESSSLEKDFKKQETLELNPKSYQFSKIISLFSDCKRNLFRISKSCIFFKNVSLVSKILGGVLLTILMMIFRKPRSTKIIQCSFLFRC